MPAREGNPRERILKCALHEFSAHGYSGARVARITRAARVNPRMLFYYFGSKEDLFVLVLESVWRDGLLMRNAPIAPIDAVLYWNAFYRNNPKWSRMVLWEGLERPKARETRAKDRRKIWEIALERMHAHRGPGGYPEFLDLGHLLLSLIAMELAPLALPHLARMITGLDPQSPKFVAERDKFLANFVQFVSEGAVKPVEALSRRPSIRRRRIKL